MSGAALDDYSVDQGSEDLARAFLEDHGRDQDEPMVRELATRIQQAIEDFLEEKGLES